MEQLTAQSPATVSPKRRAPELEPDIPRARVYRSPTDCPVCGEPRTLYVMDADREVRLTCVRCT